VSIKSSQSEFIKSFNLSPFLPTKASHSHFESKPLHLLVGFGRFIKSKVEARNGINPKTGQPIKIPTYMQPRFKAGIKLKEACNRK
jgi:hypothetical protein